MTGYAVIRRCTRLLDLVAVHPLVCERRGESHPRCIDLVVRHVPQGAWARLEDVGGAVVRDPAADLLTCNGEFTASVVIARHRETAAGSARWRIRLDAGLAPDVTVAVRMGPGNAAPLDYYVLPRIDMTGPRLRLAGWNGPSLDGYRFDDLGFFFSLAARATLTEAA